MITFGLDPQSVAGRVANPVTEPVPTLRDSVLRGVAGFTLVSIAGFVPWAVFGRALHGAIGEGGMYGVCAAVFIGLSGLALHRLVIGPGSLLRFYKLFSLAFGLYAVLWTAGWMSLGGTIGGIAGLLAGTAAMGWVIGNAFGAKSAILRTIAVLFILNAAGYFGGGWTMSAIASWDGLGFGGHALAKSTRRTMAMLSWGACYGIGFGAGLGLAFFFCQAPVRSLLAHRGLKTESAG